MTRFELPDLCAQLLVILLALTLVFQVADAVAASEAAAHAEWKRSGRPEHSMPETVPADRGGGGFFPLFGGGRCGMRRFR